MSQEIEKEILSIRYEIWEINKLIPYARNPRKNDHVVDKMAGQIKEFGMPVPICIRPDGAIVDGHLRYKAALKLGLTRVPVAINETWSESKIRAFRISVNRTATWAEWDEEFLPLELQELKENGYDLSLTGFSDDELNEILNNNILENEDLCDPDEIQEIQEEMKIKSVLGDVWLLGDHRLMCGDSTMIDNVEKLMNGEKIDLVLTDPPYGINVVKSDGNIGGMRKGKNGYGNKGQYGKEASCGIYDPIIGDDKPFDPSLLLTLAPEKIIFGANNFSSKLHDNSHWIIWYKDMPEGTDFSGAELAWTNIDKKSVKVYKFTWAGMTRQGNRKDELKNRVHPTQKPVGLFVNILNDYHPKSVIDLYGGSGTTLIACEKTNRKCIMMEISPNYCDIIIRRWQKFTGKQAILESNGKLFDDI